MRKIILLLGILAIGILVAGCTQSANPSAPTTATIVGQTTGAQVSVSPGSVTVPVPTPVVIPATGVYVYVNYMGSFSGTYGAPDNILSAQDSGEKLYPVDAVNGTVAANFTKLDSSVHPIDVRIYEDNRILKNGTSSSPAGMVNITAGL